MSKPTPAHLSKSATLRTFRATVAGLRELPDEMLVVPWGVTATPNGPIVFDEYSAGVLPGNQAAMNFTQVAGDYEHATVPREGHTVREPQEVACYGTLRIQRPGGDKPPGLYFAVTEWTASGRETIGGGHYRGVSIACQQDAQGRVLFAHSVGFVRNPAVPGVSVFSVTLPTTQPNKATPMTAIIQALLDAGIDIADDATEEQIVAALSKAGIGKNPASPDVSTFSTALNKLSGLITGLSDRIAATEAASANRDRDNVIARLTCEGVEIPLSQDMLKRFSADELLTESAKWPRGTVPVDDGSGGTLAAGTLKTFSARDNAADKATVAAQLGLDPKDL